MAFDIKKIIEDIINKLKTDKNLMSKFEKDPGKTINEVTGLGLPDDQLNQIVTGVKAKLGADKLTDAAGLLGGIMGKK